MGDPGESAEADTWRRGNRRDMATAWRGRVTEGLEVSWIVGRQRSHVPSCRDWGRGKLRGRSHAFTFGESRWLRPRAH